MVAKSYSEFLQKQGHHSGRFAMFFERYSWLRVDILLGIKKRYLFTKNDSLRLRYIVPAGVIMLFAVVNIVPFLGGGQSVVQPNSVDSTDLMPESLDPTLNDRLAAGTAFVSNNLKQAALSLQKTAPVPAKPKKPLHYALKVKAGGTIAGTLQSVGVDSNDAYYAVQAMEKYFDPRRVKVGQAVDVHFKKTADDTLEFDRMVLTRSAIDSVVVRKQGAVFDALEVTKAVTVKKEARTSVIETSLYGSALRDGIPRAIIAELIRAYSWDVDFQRDIRSGDKIEILYEVKRTEDGEIAGYGNVEYASLSVGGHPKPIYRFKMADGMVDYFGPDGRSVKKTLMKTPVDGARLSSGFGMRRHPVLGYNKMHKGVDFAAPTGTPIYAAGDGIVDFKGRKGGYGNYIRLRHNSTLKTAYAHMHKFGSGIGTGKRVSQGDVIGYVGTTGRSTGPHLHYEVIVNGQQVNPNRIDLPVGETLKGSQMAALQAVVKKTSAVYKALIGDTKTPARGLNN